MTDRFAALDLSPDWYAVVSADLTIVWVNLAFAAGFGLARDDLVGKGVFEAFPEARGAGEMEGQEIIRLSVSEVFCTGLSDRIALHGLARPAESLDGRPVFSIRHSAILGPDGAVELVAFDLVAGGTLCRAHRSGRHMSPGALALLRRILGGDLASVLAGPPPPAADEVAELATGAMEAHLDRRIRAVRSTAGL